MTTAVIVVDPNNDFTDPAGSLYLNPAETVIPQINAFLGYALTEDMVVVYTQDWHPAITTHFNTHGGPWPEHCIAGTWGAEFHRDIFVFGEVFRKGVNGEDGYSGFYMKDNETGETISTGLHEYLQERGVTKVIVIGFATDVCVKATALDAKRLGYETEVDLSLTAAVSEATLEPAIQEMHEADIVLIGAVPQAIRHYDDYVS